MSYAHPMSGTGPITLSWTDSTGRKIEMQAEGSVSIDMHFDAEEIYTMGSAKPIIVNGDPTASVTMKLRNWSMTMTPEATIYEDPI